jgi:hypothetical protein
MRPEDAERELVALAADLVPFIEAPLAYAKEILADCLSSEIPAMLGRDDHCRSGCAPRVQVLIRAEDAPRVAALMQARWNELAARDGAPPVSLAGDECPACGATEPLRDGACPSCGLQLE